MDCRRRLNYREVSGNTNLATAADIARMPMQRGRGGRRDHQSGTDCQQQKQKPNERPALHC